MRRLFRFLVCAGFAAGAMFAATARAAACDCPPLPTVSEAFQGSYAVFSGKVLSIEPEWFHPDVWNQLLVQPLTRWRGPMDDVQLVITPNSPETCGYPFVVGQEYLFYCSFTYTGILYTVEPYTTQCKRTAPLANNPDLALLPPPVLPVPARTSTWGRLKSLYR